MGLIALRLSGDDALMEPLVPIPNTKVKHQEADGTWLETARESRKLPVYTESALRGRFLYMWGGDDLILIDERLLAAVKAYVKYYYEDREARVQAAIESLHRSFEESKNGNKTGGPSFRASASATPAPPPPKKETSKFDKLLDSLVGNIDRLLAKMEDTFSQRLRKLIRKKGIDDVTVYKKANIDRRLFSKIRSDKDYKPSKDTVIALICALELDKSDADDLLHRAGFFLCHSDKRETIVQFFLDNHIFDISLINEMLDYYGEPCLGERRGK